MKKLMDKLTGLYFTVGFGIMAAVVFLPMAWAERGHRGGIGGEWILIISAIYLGNYLWSEHIQPALCGGAEHE